MKITQKLVELVRTIRALHAQGLTYPEINVVLWGPDTDKRSGYIVRRAWARRIV